MLSLLKITLRTRHLFLAILIVLMPVGTWAQHPLAKKFREQSTAIGRANPDMQMKSMMFAFQLQNPQALKQLLADQQNPASANYHRWLTPQEFGSRFGVSQAQYQRAVEWLQSNGFTVTMQPGNHLRIYFDGATQDVERAFGVNIGLYQFNGKSYYSNDLSPQIPGEFQNLAFGIMGLDNFPKEHPLYQNGTHPLLAPHDAQVGYNLSSLISSGIDGTGQSIAVVETSDFNVSDVTTFRSMFGLKQNDPQKIFVSTNPGIDTSGGEVEALLDAEWAGAIAPGATIQVVIAANQDIQSAMDYVIDQLFTTRVMSVSFGDGESDYGSQASAADGFIDSFFMQAASQGQTVVVASGDEGAQQVLSNGINSTGADINYLCASGYVVCVGGTTLSLQWDGSGNATGYLGETVWNNHLAGSNFSASGGGRSAYLPKPDYQTGLGVPADGARDVPDVAAVGDPSGPGALLVLSGVIDNHTYGGTSLGTPMWGAVFALINQYASPGGVGWANPRLYQLGSAQQAGTGPRVFNDIIAGNNNTPTVTGFSAGPGFDLATGWGSFNGNLFVTNFVVPGPAGVPIDSTPLITGTIPASASATGCGLNPTQYTVTVPAGALQLVVTLDGPANGDVDLYVRKGQRVGDTGFLNPFIADYTSQGSTTHEAVYVGPNSPNPLTAGIYYIAASNCMQTAAAFTLTANVITPSTTTKIEELSTDNGILEDYFNPTGSTSYPPSGVNGTIVVSRLRPTRYPSTLTKIRIYSTYWDTDPTGKQIRIVAFNDPAGTGVPPSAPTLLVSQSVIIPGSNGFMEYTISNPQPVIQSGDWYVGFQHPASYNGILASMNEGGVWAQADFVSTNNAVSFTGPYQQPNPYPLPNFFTPNFMMRAVVQSQGQTSTFNLAVPPVGAVTDTTSQANAQVQVGYATASTTSGSGPFGTAVYSYTPGGAMVTSSNVVTEVGVPASVPTTSGRIFIDYRAGVAASPNGTGTISIDTGIALVNRGTATANITFTLRDLTGTVIATGHYSALAQNALVQGGHTALYIDQLNTIAPDFVFPPNFSTVTKFGSLDIVSDQLLSILALRQTTNQRQPVPELLLTSTPMADLTQSLLAVPLYFAQFADGGGWTTMMVLLNTSSATETGKLQLFQNGGTPLVVQQVGGTSNSSFSYSIPAGGVYVFQSNGSPALPNVGSAQVVPDAGMNAPVGAGVFSYTDGAGVLETQAGIPSSTPTNHARIYVDESGGHDTGLAIANSGASSVNVTLNAFATNGVTPVGTSAGPLLLSGNGHDAKFAGQFINNLPAGFTGVLDISSTQQFVALTLRALTNTRGYLVTTFPIADFNQTAPNPLIFPQIADSGGYQTQIILLSTSGSASAVTLNYIGNTGAPIALKTGR